MLPNGTTGWVRRDRLSGYEVVRTHLIVDRRRLVARLERRGRTVLRARIGIGERRWPTPRGSFIVRNRITGFDDPLYGALAFGTTAKRATLTDWPGGGFIGIHGTSQPQILPGRVSHGCIRMRNGDILRLDRLMPIGTPSRSARRAKTGQARQDAGHVNQNAVRMTRGAPYRVAGEQLGQSPAARWPSGPVTSQAASRVRTAATVS